MKPLRALTSKMASDLSAANTPTSSNPDFSQPVDYDDQPALIRCFDPQQPDQPCPICKGMGLITLDVLPGDPRFGKALPCPNRPPDPDRVNVIRRLGNLEALADRTFENFIVARRGYAQEHIDSLTLALRQSALYAGSPKGWMLFEGSYGTGKTHLAAAIGNVRLAEGDTVVFITAPDLLDQLRNTFSASSEDSYDDVFERLRSADLLILDDLGAENPSGWALEKLYQLINHRYTSQLPTIITTNLPLERLDGRISSRLRDVNVVQRIAINAPDFRDESSTRMPDFLTNAVMAYAGMTFESFDTVTGLRPEEISSLRNALRVAQEFAEQPEGWLMFMGHYGSGKTHLAAAIAHHVRVRKPDTVVFVTGPDLLDHFKASFSHDAPQSFDQLYTIVRDIPLLVLDDLTPQANKGWGSERLFQLLDYRYVRRLPTVLTSANSLEDLEKLQPRLFSRLMDTRLCRRVGLNAPSIGLRLRNR
ncbi:MAG: ATP-binding protein [Anaerolineae bacterium]